MEVSDNVFAAFEIVHDNFLSRPPDSQKRWEAWRLTAYGERTSLGTFCSRDEATQAAAWDFARLNRNPKQMTDLVTNLKGQGTSDEMLRLFYDMPPLQSLLERCSITDCAEGIQLCFESLSAGDVTTSVTYIITTCAL